MKLGDRIEIPAHYDLWMRGARFGLVMAMRTNLEGGRYAKIKMDHPQVRKLVNLPEGDWDFAKVIER